MKCFLKSIERSSVLWKCNWGIAFNLRSPFHTEHLTPSEQVFVTSFIHYSIPIAGINNAMPLGRNFVWWSNRIMEMLVWKNFSRSVSPSSALSRTSASNRWGGPWLCLPEPWKFQRWWLYSPTGQHVPVLHHFLSDFFFSWFPTWNVHPAICGNCSGCIIWHYTLPIF